MAASFFAAGLYSVAGSRAAQAAVADPALPSKAASVATAGSIRPIATGLDDLQRQAQALALAQPGLAKLTQDPDTGAPLRTEVFAIYQARASDIPKGEHCGGKGCHRVDIYSFAHNLTVSMIVDVGREKVIGAMRQSGSQAELPDYLVERAIEIARSDPEVIAALGFRPGEDQVLMARTKTALNASSCERSRHLCVAPTFVVDDTALWAIVDLTEQKLVGVHWTEVGKVKRGGVTEESIKSEEVFENYCKKPTHLDRDGWALDFILTSSDGLQLSDLRHQGRPVLRSAKLVDWHVSYSSRDGFGYSDAVGCPMFSSSSVLAYGGPEIVPIEEGGRDTGFALVQDFRQLGWPVPCHYRYQQRYEFYRDGRFRVLGANLGRGCGVDGVYRPVLRLDLAPTEGQTLSQWDKNSWKEWPNEAWVLQDDSMGYTPEGYALRVLGKDGLGYYMAPGHGPFGDAGHDDKAYIFATRHHPEEGDADMVTIGPCCNTDHRQGPEKFIDSPPEPLPGEDLVIWYVAQMEIDNTPGQERCWADNVVENGVYVPKIWPCWFGPTFIPIDHEK